MTRAPDNIKAVRGLLLTHLNVDQDAVRSADLEPAEVGIVGDPNHTGGYHCGSDRVVPNDYSVVESDRDRAGLTEDASALDVGLFSVQSGGRTHNLQTFSTWCVAQCVAGAPDTRDIREIIYSPDGTVVRRWDRLKRRTSGDSSHLFHTHFSFHRDAVKAGRDLTPLFRRYLEAIGLIESEDDMDAAGFIKILQDPTVAAFFRAAPWQYAGSPMPTGLSAGWTLAGAHQAAKQAAGEDVDEAEVAQLILASLTPEKIAAAVPPGVAKAVADELAARLAGGQG